jgi:hypothetical protein
LQFLLQAASPETSGYTLVPCDHSMYNNYTCVTLQGRVLLETLTVTQLAKKIPACYVTPKFIAVLTVTGPYPEPDESNPQLPPYFSKIQSNIILLSTPSSEWSLPLRFPDQNFCTHFSYLPYVLRGQISLQDSQFKITTIQGG